MGALLYCMHVRLCMLNVSVEASRFKKAVINVNFARVVFSLQRVIFNQKNKTPL